MLIFKKSLFFYFTILITFNLNGQIVEDVFFPIDTTKWSNSTTLQGFESGMEPQRKGWDYYLMGDTIINNLEYKKIYYKYLYHQADNSGSFVTNPLLLVGAIREDTLSKQVFYFHINRIFQKFYDISISSLDTDTEYLLYDFNLEIGDTLHWIPDHSDSIVLDIDTFQVSESDYRFKYIFKYETWYSDEHYWISGIGSSLGLFGSLRRYDPNYDEPKLICFNDRFNNLLINEDPKLEEYNNCEFYYNQYLPFPEENIDTLEDNSDNTFSIYPNPTLDILFIHRQHEHQVLDVSIYNIKGQLVYTNNKLSISDTLSLVDFPPGFYILKIKYNGKEELFKFLKTP